MKPKVEKSSDIQIMQIDVGIAEIAIIGITPLIVRRGNAGIGWMGGVGA